MYSVEPGLKGSLFLFGFAALCALVGSFVLIEQFRFERSAVRAEGRVVEHVSRTALDKYKHPYQQHLDVYEFTTATGTAVRFEDLLLRGSELTPIGQTAVVYYSAAAPARARLEGRYSGLGWGCLGVAAMFVAFGALNLRRAPPPALPGTLHNREKAARRKRKSPRKQRAR